jgi:hypothetical protein
MFAPSFHMDDVRIFEALQKGIDQNILGFAYCDLIFLLASDKC